MIDEAHLHIVNNKQQLQWIRILRIISWYWHFGFYHF